MFQQILNKLTIAYLKELWIKRTKKIKKINKFLLINTQEVSQN